MKKRIIGRLTCISIVVFFIMSAALAATTDMTVTKRSNGYNLPVYGNGTLDVLYNGSVTLTPGATFTVVPYNIPPNNPSYEVSQTTPLGALDVAAATAGFTYNVTDKNYASGALLLDDVDGYIRKNPGYWYAYVNDIYKDGFNNPAGALNLIELADGDKVEFYYAADIADPTNLTAVKAAATATVKTVVSLIDVLYEDTVTLVDGNFTWTDSDGIDHVVPNLTPHGALETAFLADGFTYGGGWSGSRATALFDWIDSGTVNYTYNDSVSPKLTWNYQLNGVYQNYFSSTTGVSNNPVTDGDYIEFYYGPDQETTENATAVVRITVTVEEPQGLVDILYDGNVTLNPGTFDFVAYNSGTEYQIDSLTPHGALDAAAGIAGFEYNATDKKWASMGTMLLDDVEEYHYDSSVTPKLCWAYQVNGAKKNDFSSSEGISVYRVNDGDLVEFYYGRDVDIFENATAVIRIVVNIKEQDVIFDGDVTLLPGTFNFTAYNSGLEYQINTITPHGALETASTLGGFVYNATDKKWGSMGTMLLDDIEEYHYDGEASPKLCWAYAVNGVVKNDYSSTEGISVYELQNNDRVEYFYGEQGDTLPNATAVVRIRVHISSTDNWTLRLEGAVTEEIDREYFEEGMACIHSATYTDLSGTWEGIPLWVLVGYVDDGNTHGSGAFNDTLAADGYQVKIIASDGFNVTFNSSDIAKNDSYIIANTLNGQPLLEQHWPLKLVGSAIIPMQSVSKITTIELIGVEPFVPPASVHIIKYGADGVSIINETNVTVEWMELNLNVIGDGVTSYKFQGITNDPTDLWDPNETLGLNPPKIENAVKGTRVKDLCDLVGGMGTGTDIKFIASDGYETTLGYSNIYTNPFVQERQGDAILAWYADGEYVPDYTDGIRLFFTPNDTIFGQWDMHECMEEQYWHYYYQSYPPGDPYYPGIMYPSCAGLSAKFVSTIEIYSEPASDWTLQLDGTALGGLNESISRVYFDQAMACQFGAEHAAEYTDGSSRTWSGIPLWFLCGFVDDQDMHSDHAYNDTLAQTGYDIVITASDGYNVTINSRDTIRNNNYIVANSLNGSPIPEGDSSWPLRLVGVNVTGSLQVKGIAKITLEFPEEPTPAENVITLKEGWNFISTPKRLSSGNNTAAIFDAVDTAGHSIFLYKASTGSWHAMGTEDEILPLDGIWIYSNGTIDITLDFDTYPVQLPPTKQLYAGWNAIGFSDTEPASANDALLSVEDVWTTLLGFDAETQSYAVSIINGADGSHGEDREMHPTKGYWLYVTEDGELAAISA